jgi:hypothetical protein
MGTYREACAIRLLSFQDPAEVALAELGTGTQGSAAASLQNIRRAEIRTTTGGRIACEVNVLGRVSPRRACGILGCRPALFIIDRWRRSFWTAIRWSGEGQKLTRRPRATDVRFTSKNGHSND